MTERANFSIIYIYNKISPLYMYIIVTNLSLMYI